MKTNARPKLSAMSSFGAMSSRKSSTAPIVKMMAMKNIIRMVRESGLRLNTYKPSDLGHDPH